MFARVSGLIINFMNYGRYHPFPYVIGLVGNGKLKPRSSNITTPAQKLTAFPDIAQQSFQSRARVTV